MGEHPSDSQEEEGPEIHLKGNSCRKQAFADPQEGGLAGFYVKLTGNGNTERRTNTGQRLWVPYKNTQ